MAHYRKIDVRIWNDAKFRKLSETGKLVFFFVLTHPSLTALGAMRATAPGLAAELGIKQDRFAKAFDESVSLGLIEYDEDACFVAATNFLKYNPPESPNVVKSWTQWVDLLPECELKDRLLVRCCRFVEGMSEGYAKGLPKGFRKVLSKSMPNQEQEQEQEQEQDLYKTADTDRTIIGETSEEESAALEVCDSVPVWAESELLRERLGASGDDFGFGHQVAALIALGKLSGALVAECASEAKAKNPGKPVGMFRTILRAECKKRRIEVDRLASRVRLPPEFMRGPPRKRNSALDIINEAARKDSRERSPA